LSISDFHPKSFNPAWEVSTILIGLLSFMTSEEMTTGSVGATEAERKWASQRTRWWNSTGSGSFNTGTAAGKGNVKAGDGGAKFRQEWPELDKENWSWMKANRIDPVTGNVMPDPNGPGVGNCSPAMGGLRRPSGSQAVVGAVVEGGRAAGEETRGWVRRNKWLCVGMAIFTYVLIARLLGEGTGSDL
jgi:ubiquitin-conjugating enzyme E2 J2